MHMSVLCGVCMCVFVCACAGIGQNRFSFHNSVLGIEFRLLDSFAC